MRSALSRMMVRSNARSLIERLLDLGANAIANPSGLKHLVTLEELWINDNELESFSELEEELKDMTRLRTAYLEGNPLARKPNYETRALASLPNSLEQLDALPVEDVRTEIEQRILAGFSSEADNASRTELDASLDVGATED